MSDVAVIGLGKLGAAMAAVLASRGHNVTGVDINQEVVDHVNQGHSPVEETGLPELIRNNRARIHATTDLALAVSVTNIAFVIVPTPSLADGTFSNQYVLDAVRSIGAAIRQLDHDWYTVVICSTVMPGSTAGPIKDVLEQTSGRTVGDTLGLCYSPEFIALGSVIHDMTNPDMILVGADENRSVVEMIEVIATIPETVPTYTFLSTVNAELAKIAVNTYVTMKISFANMLAELCERLPGGDADLVADAVGTDSRIGNKYLKPGAAFGGPCFPRDNAAFIALGRGLGVAADLAIATDTINLRQVDRIATRLCTYDQISVLGLSYKPNTGVTERSFGVDLVETLQFAGIRCITFDPAARNPINGNDVAVNAQACVNASDVVVIATPWPEFARLSYGNKRVIDIWGLLPYSPNVERIGRHS